jgi:hypothetical protein
VDLVTVSLGTGVSCLRTKSTPACRIRLLSLTPEALHVHQLQQKKCDFLLLVAKYAIEHAIIQETFQARVGTERSSTTCNKPGERSPTTSAVSFSNYSLALPSWAAPSAQTFFRPPQDRHGACQSAASAQPFTACYSRSTGV